MAARRVSEPNERHTAEIGMAKVTETSESIEDRDALNKLQKKSQNRMAAIPTHKNQYGTTKIETKRVYTGLNRPAQQKVETITTQVINQN